MSEGPGAGRAALRQKSAEIAVAALFFCLGAIVVYDSERLGFRWADDGPQAGYFPFYIGAIICVASLVNFGVAIASGKEGDRTFVETGQLKLVLAVLVPTAIYVALIAYIGLYEASVLFIAYFMRWLGKYPWWKIAAVSLGNSLFFLVIFEIWFQIPLPKGPVAEWLIAALRPAAVALRGFF
jgi:putative tricarboxylic transport membrane protein